MNTDQIPGRRMRLPAGACDDFVLWLILFFLLSISASAAHNDKVSALLERARSQVENFQYKEALDLYERILEHDPGNFQALCGAAYTGGWVGKFSPEGERAAFYNKALQMARQAYELRPDDPEANFAMAWGLGGKALLSGPRERVKVAEEMRAYLMKALDKNPDDHRAWYVLGRLRYRIATAGFLERTAAKLFFGGLPEDGDMEGAIKAYRKAVDLHSGSILYRYELARALQEAGQPQEALKHYQEAAQLEPRTPEDPTLLARCRYQADQLR
ncbi:MAG TPA: tetratricopeptide repeat protein [Acidobacteriota bacterium]|nr:tetratricopeptide repeat protein [Acidobacteriota bacterium]